MEDVYNHIREDKELPHVGRAVKNRQYGTVWQVIEEREMWIGVDEYPGLEEGKSHLIPAIYLRYWKPESGLRPGEGKTMEYAYTQYDDSFREYWEIVPSPVMLDAIDEHKKAA